MNKMSQYEKVKFTVKTRGLDGILTHPASKAPYPAVVLLHGSDRSGLEHPYYEEHAEKLAQAGFAVLRYAGPGWGGGSAGEVGFETLEYRTTEAIAAVQYLQSRSDIKPAGVGLWGISQGGWICQMAAAAFDGVAFIISVSGPGVTPAQQEVYRVEMESRAAGFEDDEVAKAVLIRRLMADMVLAEPAYKQLNLLESSRLGDGAWTKMADLTYSPKQFEPAAELGIVIEILMSIEDERWAKSLHLEQVLPMLSGLPPQAWDTAKSQMRAVMIVDPANYLSKIHCPVLAIFGEEDTSIPVEASVTLYKAYLHKAGNQKLTIKVFPKASHTIRVDETFAPGYFELMQNWLSALPIE
jgi:uncharacterized protein